MLNVSGGPNPQLQTHGHEPPIARFTNADLTPISLFGFCGMYISAEAYDLNGFIDESVHTHHQELGRCAIAAWGINKLQRVDFFLHPVLLHCFHAILKRLLPAQRRFLSCLRHKMFVGINTRKRKVDRNTCGQNAGWALMSLYAPSAKQASSALQDLGGVDGPVTDLGSCIAHNRMLLCTDGSARQVQFNCITRPAVETVMDKRCTDLYRRVCDTGSGMQPPRQARSCPCAKLSVSVALLLHAIHPFVDMSCLIQAPWLLKPSPTASRHEPVRPPQIHARRDAHIYEYPLTQGSSAQLQALCALESAHERNIL